MRLKNFDYSSSGCYFVTISTHNGYCLFWDDDKLNDLGDLVENEIHSIPEHYGDIKIDNYVIMPNHIHMLVTVGCDALPNNESVLLAETLGEITHTRLDVVIGLFKSGVSRKIHKINPEIKVWQRSYYDHIIRNQKDYNEIWNYIDANPVRWNLKLKNLPYR